MTRKVMFDSAPPPGTINMAIGQPSADLLPVDLIKRASDAFFAQARPTNLNYGPLEGDKRFLAALADFLTGAYEHPASPDTLMVSGGNSQALDMVSVAFAQPGDTVFVEDPSYFLAFQIFRDHGLKMVGIPLEDDGISIKELEAALDKHQPAFLYTIPSYQNPGGQCMSAAKRNKLVELAEAHDFLIVADEVYQLLYYYDKPPPAFGTRTDTDVVISLGSFSKILSPALRLGWVQASPARCDRLLAGGMINSGGSVSHFASHIVREAMQLDLLDAHVARLRREYRARVEAMDRALESELGAHAEWLTPEGGYFFWVRFGAEVDVGALRENARDLETGFQPGHVFSVNGRFANCLRLSFAYYGAEDIAEGVGRMRPLFD